MLRAVLLMAALAAAVLAQAPGPKPENRDSSYANYEPQYQPQYQQYYQPPKFSVDKLVSGLVLPSASDIITGIIYVVAVAGVAGLVLMGLALVLKLFSLKLPIINDLKQKVISKVEKVDARMLESAWETLLNSLDKFERK
ncbi:uncharacterized protein LOC122366972 [Amphibalanus amphitrite]|uniref:uncharacterized protein LOC122366972 n=1 Tax=Amphibalanus amphitrite TaxID=1232801 RepID=UPI001C926090|nr:uncharacterized protein LOC122366972 [Amphibalanus amphitrite]